MDGPQPHDVEKFRVGGAKGRLTSYLCLLAPLRYLGEGFDIVRSGFPQITKCAGEQACLNYPHFPIFRVTEPIMATDVAPSVPSAVVGLASPPPAVPAAQGWKRRTPPASCDHYAVRSSVSRGHRCFSPGAEGAGGT